MTIDSPSPGSSVCKFTMSGTCSTNDCDTIKIQLSYTDATGTPKDIVLAAPCTEYGWSVPVNFSLYGIPNGAAVAISAECGNTKVTMTVKCNCPAAAKGAAAGQ